MRAQDGYTRNLFLRAMCVVYMFAFISFYIQIPGLYGDNGILPAKSVLENTKYKTWSAKVHYQPTLLWLAPYLGLDTQYAMDVLALLGSFLAFTGFISRKFCTVPLFAALWSLYFSLYQVGQAFVTSQWDNLLLEAGFISILVAPLIPAGRKNPLPFWLVRWLLFRFLLTSGVVKLLSNCPKWWGLQALSYHFESMVLPSPLSWHAHHLPESWLKLVTAFTNVCELVIPFLFFVPVRSVRITAYMIELFLQICIVLTGNFNFLTLLIVTLLFSLLDNRFFFKKNVKNSTLKWSTIFSQLFNFFVFGAILYGFVTFYGVKITKDGVETNIGFTKEQFDAVAKQGLLVALFMGTASLGVLIARTVANVFLENAGPVKKTWLILTTLLYSLIVATLFIASTVPVSTLHPATNSSITPTIRNLHHRLSKLQIANNYVLFTKMSGGNGRPEIVLEGSNNIEGPWLEYQFLYKPGNVNASLPFVAPYSPRLDWQMWWAAQSSYTEEPWLLSFAHRLLSGTPEVLALLDTHRSPFVAEPPKYIRGQLYYYHYTPWEQRKQTAWWTRKPVGEYFPALSKDSPALVDYLKARNLLPTASTEGVSAIWKRILDAIRYVTSNFEGTLLMWSVFTGGCAIMATHSTK